MKSTKYKKVRMSSFYKKECGTRNVQKNGNADFE